MYCSEGHGVDIFKVCQLFLLCSMYSAQLLLYFEVHQSRERGLKTKLDVVMLLAKRLLYSLPGLTCSLPR